jgi:DnaJ-class molecular chaperone
MPRGMGQDVLDDWEQRRLEAERERAEAQRRLTMCPRCDGTGKYKATWAGWTFRVCEVCAGSGTRPPTEEGG